MTKSFLARDFSFWGLPRVSPQDDPPAEEDYGDSYAGGNEKGITRRSNSILID